MLAGIGRVESDHGRFAGAVLHSDGVSTPPIIGIPLNGHGTARIADTDHGRLDHDSIYDHAVGPMQFIPATWARYGVDGNNDHHVDPFNIFDATLTAADYLCTASGGTITTLAGQTRAVLAYNQSDAYLALVLQLERLYARGVPGLFVPTLPAAGTRRPYPKTGIPAANPGPALEAATHGPDARRSPARAPRTPTSPPTSAPAPRASASTHSATTEPTTCTATTSTVAPRPTPTATSKTATPGPPASGSTAASGAPTGSTVSPLPASTTSSHTPCP